MFVQLLPILDLLLILVLYRSQRFIIFLDLIVPVSDIYSDVFANLTETGWIFMQGWGDVF